MHVLNTEFCYNACLEYLRLLHARLLQLLLGLYMFVLVLFHPLEPCFECTCIGQLDELCWMCRGDVLMGSQPCWGKKTKQ